MSFWKGVDMHDDLLRLWPTADEVDACVKREAEAIHEAVFLAVHQPMRFLRRDVGAGGLAIPRDEQHLLAEFLTEHLPEGNLILPIVGASGVGKSHVIRWIDAQLRRLPDAKRKHIIRVPKGSSLKGVLRLLLADLHGPAFDRIRKALEAARGHLEPEMAARQLQVHMRHRLERVSAEAADRIQKGQQLPFDKERREYGSVRFLPALLGEPELEQKHWLKRPAGRPGVLSLLAEQVTQASAPDDDRRRHVFQVEDLVLAGDIDFNELSPQTRKAYAFLDRDSTERREAAVRVLNEVLDDAKHDLLQLGDNTLTELFAEVRAELHLAGRELVFLVEDFVVLSGLQGALLQVMIAEAVRDGKQRLCTMRTAIAYTEGHMAGRDTVLTRARREWLVEDRAGNDAEILARVERMVGAYLNAARVGNERLARAFATVHEADSKEWVPRVDDDTLEPEERRIVDTFGRSVDGYPLFPFNRLAIEQLARRGCLDVNQRLVYNPRLAINSVLLPVLQERTTFSAGRFPPAHMGAGQLTSAEVTAHVGRLVERARLDRYLCLLRLWGGQPASLVEAARMSREIYEAFGLEWIDFGGGGRTTTPGPRTTTPGPGTTTPPPPTEEQRWLNLLEEWAGGGRLGQAPARQVRGHIADAIEAYIPFDALLCKPRWKLRDEIKKIYLPRAEGQAGLEPKTAMLVVATDDVLADPIKRSALVSTLMALVRRYEIHKSWDYPGAEVDGGRVRGLMERLAPAAAAYIGANHFQIDLDAAPALVGGLLVGARALGHAGVQDRSTVKDLLNAVFHPGAASSQDAQGRWAQVQSRLQGSRAPWQSMLLELVGARQGGAAAVHAIDAGRVVGAMNETRRAWEFPKAPPSSNNDRDYYAFAREVGELRLALEKAIQEERSALTSWHAQTISWFGDDFDKLLVQKALRDIITEVKRTGLVPGADFEGLRRQLAELPRWRLMEGLDAAARLSGDCTRGEVLTLLAPGHGPTIEVTRDFMKEVDRFLTACERSLAGREAAGGSDIVDGALEEIASTLDAIGVLLERWEGVRR